MEVEPGVTLKVKVGAEVWRDLSGIQIRFGPGDDSGFNAGLVEISLPKILRLPVRTVEEEQKNLPATRAAEPETFPLRSVSVIPARPTGRPQRSHLFGMSPFAVPEV